MRERTILLAQARVRDINTRRALTELDEIKDITELDWMLARGDREIKRLQSLLKEQPNCPYNLTLTEQVADDAYRHSLEKNQLPCQSRSERAAQRSK